MFLLIPLKTPENLWISDVSKGIKKGTLGSKGLNMFSFLLVFKNIIEKNGKSKSSSQKDTRETSVKKERKRKIITELNLNCHFKKVLKTNTVIISFHPIPT